MINQFQFTKKHASTQVKTDLLFFWSRYPHAKFTLGAIAGALDGARKVDVEEALEAAEAGADIILLDNMNADDMHRVVDAIPAQIKTEASGGITLENVRQAAMAGVDIISIGALTHSAKALDISLELEPETVRLD